ncbi:uncharacterized protein (TIGR02246 family) [Murinocardiopsis flavida]|uniref:Uncharacterized protein (TIGR02246 family) n=1 Tax=Murinocardiopsis flavida TaxID=645275 RepID=A0A2P8CT09_9ACTN|nr:SgcJ/EcaC family oxidoreductase [Murinocardiopsis flavida]PSK88106.1 uncharacterized protein (TIGR02246 family) [Murinocardiopsis flavida]
MAETADEGRVDGADMAALHELLQQQVRAWAVDGAAFAATFTEDADFVAVNGEHLRTRAEITESLQEGFATFMANTRMSQARETHIRFASPTTAVVITSGVCVLQPGAEECRTEDLSIQTRVAMKQDGEWLFTSFHNSRMWNAHG